MKDSGIEWIGDIPENWLCHRNKYNFTLDKTIVGEACDSTQLLSLSKQGIKAITAEEQSGKVPTSFVTYQVVHKDDIVMCLFDLDVSAVFSGRSDYDGMISPAYKCFRVNSHMNPHYVDYYYQTVFVGRKYKRYAKNVRYSLSSDEFLSLSMLVPPTTEQQLISEYLDMKCSEIDALIADVQTQIEMLEQYKHSVITEAVTKGLNPNASMKDSGTAWIDTIPSHWFLIPAKYMFHNSDLRRIGDDVLLTSSQKYGIISQIDYMERENAKIVLANKGIEDWKHVEPYDFIISLRSFQGGLEMSEITGCITWHYVVLKASRTIVPKYYKWLFKSQAYITALQRTCNFIRDGQDLRFSNFSQVPLPEPPIEEQEAIAAYLDTKCAEIDAIIDGKRQQMATLEEYKKSIIFECVTGKKEVSTYA